MAPRTSIGDKPMSPAERVRRVRWANRLEETASKLLELLEEKPNPLPRKLAIPKELLERLTSLDRKNITLDTSSKDEQPTRVLKLGNGNQAKNKQKALMFVAAFLDAEIIDNKTLRNDCWGYCHLSAYTHPKGAMISTPNRPDNNFGDAEWHKNDHVILFRDVGDGRCILYITKIGPLFERRTIGHHGVTWENVEEVAELVKVLGYKQVSGILEQVSNVEKNPVIENHAKNHTGMHESWFTFYDTGIKTLDGLPAQAKLISEYLIVKFAGQGPVSNELVKEALYEMVETGKLKSRQPVLRIFGYYAQKLQDARVFRVERVK